MVRKGYKQTEVGEIPEDWSLTALGDIFTLGNGFAFSSKYFGNDGPIVLTPGNFKLDGGLYFNERNTKRYSGSYPKSTVFSEGDLLVVMTDLTPDCNLLGKPAVVENIGEKVLHNQRIGKVNIVSEKISKGFLFYIFLSEIYLKRLKDYATGSTVRHTSNGTIYGTVVPHPDSEHEQKEIAKALSNVDELIFSLEKLIAKKRDIKTATMQQLLTGRKRLLGFGEGKGYKRTELGETPEDWDVKLIGDLFKVTAGGDLRKQEFSIAETNKYAYPIYSNALSDFGIYGFSSTYDYSGKYITITARGGIGHAEDRNGSFCAIGRLLVLKPNLVLSCKYMSEYINGYVEFANESTGVPQLTAPQVSKYSVLFPPEKEQDAISKMLKVFDKEIISLQKRLAKTKAIKQGMMQELLTGRTRLVDVPFSGVIEEKRMHGT